MEQQTTTASPANQFGVNQLGPEATETPELDPNLTVDVADTQGNGEVVDTEAQAREQQAADEASRFGWVPREEWKGDPARWRSASEFLEVRENIRKVASDENSALRAKIAAMEQREVERARREQEVRDKITTDSLEAELQGAYENQDWGKVRELTGKIIDAKTKTAAAPKAPAVDPALVQAADRFKAENAWVEKDRELGASFALEIKNIVDLKLTDTFEDAMRLAKSRVQRLYPEKFRVNSRGRSPMAEMSGTPTGTSNGRAWSDLKPRYRELAEADIRAKKYTQAEYLQFAAEDPAEYFKS